MKRFVTFFVLGLLCWPAVCSANWETDSLFGSWKVVKCQQDNHIVPMSQAEAENLHLGKVFSFRTASITSDSDTHIKPMYRYQRFSIVKEYSSEDLKIIKALSANRKLYKDGLLVFTSFEFPLDTIAKYSDSVAAFGFDGFLSYMVRIPSVCGAYIQESSAVEELKLTGDEDTLRFNYDFTLGPVQLLI